jgi:CheY-like chemotaxis protein
MRQTQILIVEPDLFLADLYAKYLEQEGFIVEVQYSAQSAINSIDSFVPDIIVIELQMAGHGGYELLYELRSYPEWQKIMVILNTFVPRQVVNLDSKIMKQLDISAYLYKPATKLVDLKNCIDDCVIAV